MSKARLTRDELQEISHLELEIKVLLEQIEKAKRFNVGDYLVRFYSENKEPDMNSYHIARRFKVVHVDANGIGYIKEVMGGKVSSQLMMLSGIDAAREIASNIRNGYHNYSNRYELDPLYEDHILMSQDGEYNPALEQLNKSKLHKEIATYNKSIKINTDGLTNVLKYARTLKVGDTLWFSNVTQFMIHEIKTLPRNPGAMSYDPVIIGKTNKGKTMRLSLMELCHKAIYTACPRSYKELKT